MLKKPDAGWSEITIGDWTDRCSYLDDVPMMLLEAVGFVLPKRQPRMLHFDAEGWEYYLILNFWEAHIISEPRDCDDEFESGETVWKHWDIEICAVTFAEELIGDIRRDVDEWAAWFITDGGKRVAARRRKLLALCDKIEEHVKKERADLEWELDQTGRIGKYKLLYVREPK